MRPPNAARLMHNLAAPFSDYLRLDASANSFADVCELFFHSLTSANTFLLARLREPL